MRVHSCAYERNVEFKCCNCTVKLRIRDRGSFTICRSCSASSTWTLSALAREFEMPFARREGPCALLRSTCDPLNSIRNQLRIHQEQSTSGEPGIKSRMYIQNMKHQCFQRLAIFLLFSSWSASGRQLLKRWRKRRLRRQRTWTRKSER